jgi:hypothetical protein
MSFFNSEVVRAELAEITELQEDLYNSVFTFHKMDHLGKMEHVEILQRLLDKQKVLYTRLSLSDDPEAKKMKEKISESAAMMGLPANVDMNVIFSNMQKIIEKMKDQIDKFDSK